MQIDGEKLPFFQDLLDRARSEQGTEQEKRRKWMAQYNGDLTIDGSDTDALVGYNLTYELIESTKDMSIPAPQVTARVRSEKTTRNCRAIEQLCRQIYDDLDMEELNDMDELMTYINGGSVWLVEWDDNPKDHGVSGKIVARPVDSDKFYPQPWVYDTDDMDYCVIGYTSTNEELVRRYGVSLSSLLESADNPDSTNPDEVSTVFVCFYRGEDGAICKYVWTGDVELEDIEDYWSRKIRRCEKCGQIESLCSCKHPKIITEELEYEEIEEDIVLDDGTIIPAEVPKYRDGEVVTEKQSVPAQDASGMPVLNPATGLPELIEQDVPKMVPNRIKWYKPTTMPIIVRKNIAKPKSLFGQSDCEFIRPSQQEYNKTLSRLHEKLMKSGVIPVVPTVIVDDEEQDTIEMNVPTNSIYKEFIKLPPGVDKNMFGVIDTSVNIQQDIAYAQYTYDMAKKLMGITESYQGNYDASADSGKAKQIQVNQAAGRLQTKRTNKNLFISKLNKVFFQLTLAYADEPRPTPYTDEFGEVQNLQFDRRKFLEWNEDKGCYEYDDRYDFSVDSEGIEDIDKPTMWQSIMSQYQMGMYGNPGDPATLVRVWTMLERYKMPVARENVNYWKAMVKQQQEQGIQMPQGGENPVQTGVNPTQEGV